MRLTDVGVFMEMIQCLEELNSDLYDKKKEGDNFFKKTLEESVTT